MVCVYRVPWYDEKRQNDISEENTMRITRQPLFVCLHVSCEQYEPYIHVYNIITLLYACAIRSIRDLPRAANAVTKGGRDVYFIYFFCVLLSIVSFIIITIFIIIIICTGFIRLSYSEEFFFFCIIFFFIVFTNK